MEALGPDMKQIRSMVPNNYFEPISCYKIGL